MEKKTAEDFVKEHEDSFAYLKEVSDPEVYQFYLAVIATVCKQYAFQETANLYTEDEVLKALQCIKIDVMNAYNETGNDFAALEISTTHYPQR